MELKEFNIDEFNPAESMFIEASAGTGKTYTIQQIVAKLLLDLVPLSKLLVVTFTDKAAGELKDRIRSKIEEVIRKGGLTKEQLQNMELSLEQIDNASIFTIHSFCKTVSAEFAFEARSSFEMSLVDDSEVGEFLDKLIRDEWPKDDEFISYVEETGFNIVDAANEIKALVSGAISKYRGTDEAGNDIVGFEKLSDAYEALDGIFISGENISRLVEADKHCLLEGEIPFVSLCRIDFVLNAFEVLKKHKDETFSVVKVKKTGESTEKLGFSVSDFIDALNNWNGKSLFNAVSYGSGALCPQCTELEESLRLFYSIKDCAKDLVSNAIDHYYAKLKVDLVSSQTRKIYNRWNEYKKQNKLQSFDDMIMTVYNCVLQKDGNGNDSNFCNKLREKYSYGIIDEFQDTNRIQWDIFKKVFLNVPGHAIYVVGDPKQAIYGFRSAELSVYNTAVSEIGKGTELKSNYRSTNDLIAACNEIFSLPCFFSDSQKGITFNKSLPPKDKALEKKPPMEFVDGEYRKISPVWVSGADIDSNHYADISVQRMVNWCRWIDEKRTALRIWDKDLKDYRNVSFKDFCILARTRTEMLEIESKMGKYGVPFTRYKDTNLFSSDECTQWISLFRAINADDFSGANRGILNEALATEFFGINIMEVDDDSFDDPMNEFRLSLAIWKKCADAGQYALMLEKVYEHSYIEDRLTDLSKLQNLAKIHQIGNYAIEYLYNHNCSIDDLIQHLSALYENEADTDDEDGNLVARDTDFDAVTVMTIHASKGLEFPVVISVAGFKQFYDKVSPPYLYHGDDGIIVGFTSNARNQMKAESLVEWVRLFYVDFTRASSVLVLPFYKLKKDLKFLYDSMKSFSESSKLCTVFGNEYTTNVYNKVSAVVRDNILPHIQKTAEAETVDRETQLKNIEKLNGKMNGMCIFQHSYSSLSGKMESVVSTEEDENLNKNGLSSEDGDSVKVRGIDVSPIRVKAASYMDEDVSCREDLVEFPRGARIGNALHSILEHLDFTKIENFASARELFEDGSFIELAEKEFEEQLLLPNKRRDEWLLTAAEFVFNTMNGVFPVVNGSEMKEETFRLTSIGQGEKKAELQFNFTGNSKFVHGEGIGEASLEAVMKGFIDLLFVRKDEEGNLRYSILDWKSDYLGHSSYNYEAVSAKVDEEYSIQRVLYCYCLIKWLKQFYSEMSEEEIFQKHFGGIYYVFLRGCRKDCSNGIYAQTWKNYACLEAEYKKLKAIMYRANVNREAV